MKRFFAGTVFLSSLAASMHAQKRPTDYVNPILGTAPLTNLADIGFNLRGGYRQAWYFRRRLPLLMRDKEDNSSERAPA